MPAAGGVRTILPRASASIVGGDTSAPVAPAAPVAPVTPAAPATPGSLCSLATPVLQPSSRIHVDGVLPSGHRQPHAGAGDAASPLVIICRRVRPAQRCSKADRRWPSRRDRESRSAGRCRPASRRCRSPSASEMADPWVLEQSSRCPSRTSRLRSRSSATCACRARRRRPCARRRCRGRRSSWRPAAACRRARPSVTVSGVETAGPCT